MTFSLGLPAYIMIKIFASIYFARHDTKTPVKIAVTSMIINLSLNLLLLKPFAHVGLAFATAVAAWFNALVLFYLLRKKGHFEVSARFKSFLPKLAITNLIALIIIYGLRQLLWVENSDSFIREATSLTFIIGVSLIAYLAACYFTGIIKKSDIKILTRNNSGS